MQYILPVLVMVYSYSMIAVTLWRKREIGEVGRVTLTVFTSILILTLILISVQTVLIADVQGSIITAGCQEESNVEVKTEGE